MKNDVLIFILWVSVQWASAQDTVYIDKNYRWYDKAGAVEYALFLFFRINTTGFRKIKIENNG